MTIFATEKHRNTWGSTRANGAEDDRDEYVMRAFLLFSYAVQTIPPVCSLEFVKGFIMQVTEKLLSRSALRNWTTVERQGDN